ncbi:hypothetical protein JCM11491_003969 [Sporobolomyces phaffii]
MFTGQEGLCRAIRGINLEDFSIYSVRITEEFNAFARWKKDLCNNLVPRIGEEAVEVATEQARLQAQQSDGASRATANAGPKPGSRNHPVRKDLFSQAIDRVLLLHEEVTKKQIPDVFGLLKELSRSNPHLVSKLDRVSRTVSLSALLSDYGAEVITEAVDYYFMLVSTTSL